MHNKRIYLIGIGGSGMTALAEILLEKGYAIAGSDQKDFKARKSLEKKGAKIFLGQKTNHVKKNDTVVYSSAISSKHIELKATRRMKNQEWNRFDWLMKILASKKIIGISGTHGKSTTTAMLAHVLQNMKQYPTVYLGAKSDMFPLGARWGKGEYAVLETDEHDKSFLKAPSFLPIITNVDNDHLDKTGPYAGKFSLLKKAFADFGTSSKSGLTVLNGDDPFLKKLAQRTRKCQVFTFGMKNPADCQAKNIKFSGIKSTADLFWQGKRQGTLQLSVPGKENIYNALAVVTASQILGLPLKEVLRHLSKFTGTQRRFTVLHNEKVAVVDDYAHHPTEIRAVLSMAKTVFPKRRIILILEPHRYSRVSLLAASYAPAVKNADVLFLLPIDTANEKPIIGVDSGKIYRAVKRKKALPDRSVYLIKDPTEFLSDLVKFKKKGDVFLFAGPGSIARLPEKFIYLLKKHESRKR